MAAKRAAKRTTSRRRGISYDAVRKFAISLPGVEEGTSYGTPAFRIRKKLLTRVQPDFDNTLVLSSDEEELEILIAAHPEAFFITDHYAGYPCVLVRLDEVSPALFKELFESAWRRYASKKQLAEFEARS